MSCSSSSDDNDDAFSQFDGSFVEACALSANEAEVWEIFEITIQASELNLIGTKFSDAQCIQAASMLETSIQVVFTGASTVTS